jgi:shikimate kinase
VPTDKVYLVGFMGAGKSTLARRLGARLDWRIEDIDERIEAREGRSVSAIFASQGEPYFRQVERRVLLDLLPLRHVVVATGGGTFADPDNRALINRDGLSVWLDVPLAGIVDRIPADGRRPLAADRAQFERLYEVRRTAYQHAHVHLDAGDRAVDALVEQLLDRLEK